MTALPIRRTPVLVGALIAVFIAVYSATASRTVIIDAKDAAEFQTVGAAGGIPHQPYPLWCIVARSASLVPLGEPAFRVTFVSILFASLSVGVLFVLILRRTRDITASACAGLAFGLSCTWWQNAVIAEVYALNAFLFVTALLLIERMDADNSRPRSLLLALVLGFMLSGVTLNVAVLPAVVLLWIARLRKPGRLPGHGSFVHLIALLLPFTLYLHTFLVDRGPYPMNWLDNIGQYYAQQEGMTADEFSHFSHRMWLQMWPGRLHADTPSIASMALNLRFWTKQLVDSEFPFVGALLVVVGLVVLRRRDTRAFVFLVTLASSYVLLILSNIGGELYAHSIPVYMVCALCIGVALADMRTWKIGSLRIGRTLFVVTAIALLAFPFLRHMKASAFSRTFRSEEHLRYVESAPGAFVHLRSNNRDGPAYAAAVGESIPPGSLVLAGWTEANTLFYYQIVLGELRDIKVHYLPPTPAQALTVIDRADAGIVYLTRLPGECGLDTLRVRATVPILPGSASRPPRNLYAIVPP